jgi:hypothetical protein
MRNTFIIGAFGASLLALVAQKALTQPAPPTLEADIDPRDCEAFVGDSGELKSEKANVAANANWIIGECHISLSPGEVADAGGPFKQAQQFWDFECSVGLDDATVDDIPAFASHAVLTPSGVLNIVCVAAFPAPTPIPPTLTPTEVPTNTPTPEVTPEATAEVTPEVTPTETPQ